MLDLLTAAALSGAAGRALARFGGKQLADRAAELVHLQRAEIRMLTELQRELDSLLAAPFMSATRLIEDAGRAYRTLEDRRKYLDEARQALTLALSQDKDPLRLSSAALLLAAVWVALGYPEDVPDRLREAHGYAVKAALAMADAGPPVPQVPRSRLRRMGQGLARAALPVVWRHRPKAVRIGIHSEATLFGRRLVTADQFMATENARTSERDLVALNHYVNGLRELRIQWGEASGSIPEYEVVLLPGVGTISTNLLTRTSTFLYALGYHEAAPAERRAPEAPALDAIPSDAMKRLSLQLGAPS